MISFVVPTNGGSVDVSSSVFTVLVAICKLVAFLVAIRKLVAFLVAICKLVALLFCNSVVEIPQNLVAILD